MKEICITAIAATLITGLAGCQKKETVSPDYYQLITKPRNWTGTKWYRVTYSNGNTTTNVNMRFAVALSSRHDTAVVLGRAIPFDNETETTIIYKNSENTLTYFKNGNYMQYFYSYTAGPTSSESEQITSD